LKGKPKELENVAIVGDPLDIDNDDDLIEELTYFHFKRPTL